MGRFDAPASGKLGKAPLARRPPKPAHPDRLVAAIDRRPPSPPPSPDPIDAALDALRRQYRAGGGDRVAHMLAEREIRRLRDRAATQQAVAALADIDAALRAYRDLPQPRLRDEITRIANGLKALRPLLTSPSATPPPVGKLNEVVAPGRAPKPPAKARKTPEATRSDLSLAIDEPVTKLPSVGPSLAKKLSGHKAKIETVGDLLTLAPSRHIDYSRTVPIGAALRARPGEDVTVRGEIVELREIRGAGPPRVQAKLADRSGWMKITWFSTWVARELQEGDEIVASGAVEDGYGPMSFTNPEWERAGAAGLSTGRLIPVYPLTKDVGQKTLRRLTHAALDATRGRIDDHLPPDLRRRAGVPDLATAYEQLHYPDEQGDVERAQKRLAFDDLLLLQLGHVSRRRARKAFGGIPLTVDPALIARFLRGLPFSLTGGQRQALDEILAELASPRPMTRLLQGDVGSGKTVVAAAAGLVAVDQGAQVAVMAPTEILAEQHFHNFRGLYSHLPEAERPAVALLTGSTRAAERRRVREAIQTNDVNVLVGTHALIQDGVEFARLALTVVDEQHRFGVRQRAELPNRGTGAQPHQLAMSATPIPRTLNMVVNGDLDVSVIAELPPGRVPIETRRYLGDERETAYRLVREEIGQGRQTFVICPLVEESEAIEAKAAVAEAKRLQEDVFPDLKVALIHGRLSGREKDAIMTAFRDREFDILVATSVIEVGIDVPNATVMLIEGADRFGLAQLHQFRGRVGRGAHRSYCLLLADETTPEGEERLQTMVETSDGFVLAQKDLELRGPGDFVGTRQSGLPEMSWLDGSFDTRLLDNARREAERLLDADPTLSRPEHALLKERLLRFWHEASPDLPL